MSSKKQKIAEHKIVSVESDRDRVRLRPAIYTTGITKEGCEHIIYEIVDNALDEINAHDSIGDTVTLDFNDKTKVFSVEDNGGGIPHDGMLKACSVLSSSGKYNNNENSHFGASSGFNGYGSKLLTFLSDWAVFTSHQNGKSLTYKFIDGILKDTIKEKSKSHGTKVSGLISKKILPINEVTSKDIEERFKEKSYLYPDVKMILILDDGNTRKEKLYTGATIADRVSMWKPDTEIVHVKTNRKVTILEDITDDNLTEKTVDIDIAFAFKEDVLDSSNNDYIISYANGVKTYAHGTHVDGLRDGIVKYFKKEVIPKLKGRDKELPIIPTDMTAGLCSFVSARVYNPEFRGQYKDRLDNIEVKYAVRDAVYEELCSMKPADVNKFIDFVKRVTRGRIASKKTRKKDVSNAFSKDRIDKFVDIVYNLETTDPELVLLEGDSAAGTAVSARDPHNQAVYSVKKPKNIFDTATENVNNTKSVFNDILDICGIEAGKKCDPSKSNMRRILMLTDGDIDGDGIAISVVCLLAKHCRPLVDAGMVGRILPPAYAYPIGNGKRNYVHSRREFFKNIMQKFSKDVKIGCNGKEFTKKGLYNFLTLNFDYDKKLKKLAERYCCEPKLMEYIAWNYHGDNKSQKKSYWLNVLKKHTELKVLVENGLIIIDGDIPGYDYINLAFDDYFDRYVKRFKKYQAMNNTITGYTINNDKDKTLYEVMNTFRKYLPNDIKRFKGLGELDPKELRQLCMNVKERTVVVFKFKDFEKDMEKINIIISTRKEFVEARINLLGNMRADDMDIDT